VKIKKFAVGALWTNCYVIYTESKDAVLADPGGEMREVIRFLDGEGLKLHYALLTHGHGDHIMGVGEIRGRALHGVAVHSEDAGCLSDSVKNLSSALGTPAVFDGAEHILKDGETIEAGGMRVLVIHTPGHTPGGCCFYIKEPASGDELLISGDTLFARSIGRTDLPGGDEAALLGSLEKLDALPGELRAFPGHGPDTTIADERRLNPFWPR
jgi:glyoxylase-like metal-dependent hydrolase (beta-lactamase superfamily II)